MIILPRPRDGIVDGEDNRRDPPKSLVAHQTQGFGSDRRTESVSQSVRRRHYRDNDSKSVSHSLSVWTGPDRGNS
jgi:hypothetical protein